MVGLEPGPAYLDSSALAKLYLPEPESAAMNRLLTGRAELIVSELAVTEVVSAICRRVRAGRIAASAPARVREELLLHLQQRRYQRVELTPEIHRWAERQLIEAQDSPILRGMDALHLALAIAAGSATMLSYDRRLREAAAAAGLALYPA